MTHLPPTGQQGIPSAVERRPRRWPWVLAALVAGLLLGGLMGAAGSDDSGRPQATPITVTKTVTVTVTQPAPSAPKPSTIVKTVTKTVTVTPRSAAVFPGDGVFLVPADVRPGTYRSAGGDGCYWARLRSTAGDLGAIIANGNPTGPVVVTIGSGDKAFETQRCAEWSRVG
jgi:hypothetical protein